MNKNKDTIMYYLKLKFGTLAETLSVTIVSFVTPVALLFFSVFSLILADFITGYVAARTRGEAIESRKMWRSAYKCIAFLFILLACHSIDTNILASLPDVPFFEAKTAAMMSLLIVISELKSIDENIYSAFGWSYWAVLEDKFKWIIAIKFKKTQNYDN